MCCHGNRRIGILQLGRQLTGIFARSENWRDREPLRAVQRIALSFVTKKLLKDLEIPVVPMVQFQPSLGEGGLHGLGEGPYHVKGGSVNCCIFSRCPHCLLQNPSVKTCVSYA